MNLSPIAKLLIAAAWTGLKTLLTSFGVPPIVISAIAAVLEHFGLLGNAQVSTQEAQLKAMALHSHCSGVACPPDLK